MNLFSRLYEAHLTIGGHPITWREIVGNAFGFASAIGGLRRRVWAWPIGIVGNLLLFTVFIGATFDAQAQQPLFGQAGRQVFFIITSVYGWWRWRRNRRLSHGASVEPHWASQRQRLLYGPLALAAVVLCYFVFRAIGAGFPVPWWYYLADSWIFVGSMLATYAMARGWVEFWLCWIAVDLVGVPELLHFRYYPSAILYAVYAGFVIWGFIVWLGISRTIAPRRLADPAIETVA
jgi:nicotinamide mononucleotide transporter